MPVDSELLSGLERCANGDCNLRIPSAILNQHTPTLALAQPFRLLAHNGEINTIAGNRNWANARGHLFKSDRLPEIDQSFPVNSTGSIHES